MAGCTKVVLTSGNTNLRFCQKSLKLLEPTNLYFCLFLFRILMLKGLSWADQKYIWYCKSKAWWCLVLYNLKLSAGVGDGLPHQNLDLFFFQYCSRSVSFSDTLLISNKFLCDLISFCHCLCTKIVWCAHSDLSLFCFVWRINNISKRDGFTLI